MSTFNFVFGVVLGERILKHTNNFEQNTSLIVAEMPIPLQISLVLVLSASGGFAKEATNFYKRLASLLADKWDQPYSKTMNCMVEM